MGNIQKLATFLQKKSTRAETLCDYEGMAVLGVSNKLGITETGHKKSKDLSKYQLIESGDFAYNPYRINVGSIGLVPTGTRGLVSPAYVVFSTTDKLISELLLDFLKSKEGLFQIGKYARGTVRKALRFEDLCQIDMPIPLLNVQKNILTKKISIKTEVDILKTELTHQQTLLKKLRQQILQEAIEGKLTADWRKQNPDDEPARELLKRIQAEKEQLIKDKKIKKQKLLPPISEEEKPFDLPEGWVWCRVDELANIGTGATPLTSEPSYYDGEINWMTSADTSFDFVTYTKRKITEKAIKETNCQVYPLGTLVVAMYGQGKTRGQVTELKINAATNQACVAIQLYLFSIDANQFLKIHFKKIYNEIRKLAQGGAQPNLNMGKIKANVVALPPLPEQKAIVTKVEKLLTLCDQLESQITSNKSHAEQLMQAVLKEAFSQEDKPIKAMVAHA